MTKKKTKKHKKEREKERSSTSCEDKRKDDRERRSSPKEKRKHREGAGCPRSPREGDSKKEGCERTEGKNKRAQVSRKSQDRDRKVSQDSRRYASTTTKSSSRTSSKHVPESTIGRREEQIKKRSAFEEPRRSSAEDQTIKVTKRRLSIEEQEDYSASKRRSNKDQHSVGSQEQMVEELKKKEKETAERRTDVSDWKRFKEASASVETKVSQNASSKMHGTDKQREITHRSSFKEDPLLSSLLTPRISFKIPKRSSAVKAHSCWSKGSAEDRSPVTSRPAAAPFATAVREQRRLGPAEVPSQVCSSPQKPSRLSRVLLGQPDRENKISLPSTSALVDRAGRSSPPNQTNTVNDDQEMQLVEELYLARSNRQLQVNMVESYGELTGMDVDPPEEGTTVTFTPGREQRQQDLLIVLDTNVLLSHLDFVKKIRSHGLGALGFPTLLVPWVVLQELDALKSGKLSKEVEHKARPAVDYIYMCLKNHEPRLWGQSMQQASQAAPGMNAVNNDDRVLQCCLQYQDLRPGGALILCTNDKNLCSKALLSGVKAMSKADLMEQMGVNSGLLNFSSALGTCPSVTLDEERRRAKQVKKPGEEDEVSRTKTTDTERELSECVSVLESSLQSVLSIVLKEEMKAAFGELWTEIVYVKPPWTLEGVLQCFRKHWIAVFGTVIKRTLLSNVETLSDFLCTDTSVDRSSVLMAVCTAKDLLLALRNRSPYSSQVDSTLSCLKALKHRLQAEKTPVEDTSDGDTLMAEAVEYMPVPPQASYQEVWALFQIIWNNVCHVSSALFSSLNFSPDSVDPVQPCSTPPPQDALSCLHRLSTTLGQLLEAFHRLLSVGSSVEDAQDLLTFIHTSALTDVEPRFSAKDLFECLSQEEYRDKLSVGGSQLMDLKSKLDLCGAAVCGLNPCCT